jgi:hypothetical protein
MERDAASAIVFKDRGWIFGGWLHPYLPSPRDAWSSDDGKFWRLEIEKTPLVAILTSQWRPAFKTPCG